MPHLLCHYAVLQLRNIAVLLHHTQFTLTQLILQAFDLRWQHRIRSPQPAKFVAIVAHDEKLTPDRQGAMVIQSEKQSARW